MGGTIAELSATLNDPSMLHAAMVHVPIALCVLTPLALLAAGVMPARRRMGSFLATVLYALLALAALVTIQTAEAAYHNMGNTPEATARLAHDHGEMAERIWTAALALAAVAAVGTLKHKKALALTAVWVAFAGGLALTGWAAVASHQGGVLVYEHGVGTPNPVMPDDTPEGEFQTSDPRLVHFITTVRPALEETCFGCHRPGRTEGGLLMTTMEGILEGGMTGPALVPGDPDGSLLYQTISGQHPRLRMPKRGDTLTEAQVEAVRLWIERGAVWHDDE